MIFYDSSDKKLLDVTVDDNSYRNRAIMDEHSLTLYYSLAEHVELPVGAYCVYQNETYTLERPEAFKMKHSRLFEYTVTLESSQAKAKIWKFRNPVDGRLKFSLTAKPIEHLQMFVDNMNRRDTGWAVGKCIECDEVLISYDHAFCYEALSQMASELDTEFEIVGKTVSLCKVEYNKNNPLPLSYGRGNGFKPNVGRSNYGDNPPTEILYTQGGSDNIDASKYGSTELLLPKSQTIGYDGVYFEDEEGYNEANARHYITDDLGYSMRRTDKELTSLAEDSLDCSDIYPKRVGVVSAVVVVDAENNFYDFIDADIPDSLNYEDYIIDGETMTVIFQSGMLAGREFEVAYYHEVKNDKLARRFEIVPQEIDGQTMPNETFAPAVGDKYAIFNCMLPDAYICDNATKSGASWDMFRKGVKYLFDNEETKFTFTGELDGLWSKKDWTNIGGRIKLGGYILFSDERFQSEGVLVRIIGIKDYINKPYSPELELSNDTVSTSFSTTVKTLQSQEVLVEDYHRDALQFTKRRFRDAKETMSMLESALLSNFTESITPIAIQTMQMLVGDESLQFRFVSDKTSPTEVAHTITYDQDGKVLTAAAGIIQHLTLGISSLSSDHEASEYLYWDIGEYTSATLTDGTKKYYLYAKVSKTAETGEFILSEDAIKLESVSGYYHLLVGILNSEYDGERSFVTLYGYTEILPGRITTDRIVSGSGTSYFDMLNNAMKLGDALDFNSKGDGKLRIKGTIVQSQGGTESYIGCFRGEYNSSYTYYNGDEVTYYNGVVVSTYRMIYSTAVKGITPTNSVYWQVVAQGSEGASITIKGKAQGHYKNFAALKEAMGGNYEIDDVYLLDNSSDLVDAYTEGIDAPTILTYVSAPDYNWKISAGTEGDTYVIEDESTLYSCHNNSWINLGNIKGEKGDTGSTGNYTELRYAKNGSTTTPPSLTATALAPSGWSTEQPTLGSLEYLWLTTAVKTGDGSTLVSNWTTPIRVTPYNGVDGTNGTNGTNGSDFAWNLLKSTKAYTGVDGASTLTGETYNDLAIRLLTRATTETTVYTEHSLWSNCIEEESGQTYLFSFWAKGTGTLTAYFYGPTGYIKVASAVASNGNESTSTDGNIQFALTDEWCRYWVKWTLKTGTPSVNRHVLLRLIKQSVAASAYICGAKLCKGDVFSTEWSPAEDEINGRGIARVEEYYGTSTNAYVEPTEWSAEIPTVDSTNKYLWNKERILYSDGTYSDYTTPVVIGAYGDNGRGILSVVEMYLATSASTGVTKNTVGWSTTVQDISKSKPYLYNYEIIKYTDGTSDETDIVLIGRWGNNGEDGEDGSSPAAVYRGTYSSTKTYYGNSKRVDIVKSGDTYYVTRVDAPASSFSGLAPNIFTLYWNSYGASFESVATSLLLAELANIAGFIFRNERLESQTLADGTTTEGATTSTPMVYLNGKTGQVSFAGGKVVFNADGTVNIGNGKFTIDASGNVTMNNVVMTNITANSGTFAGVIKASGGLIMNVVKTTASKYTLSASTTVLITKNTSLYETSFMVVTLPSSPNTGQVLTIVNSNRYVELRIYGNGHRITPSCGDTMYGSKIWEPGLYLPLAPQRAKQLIYDGSAWWQINGFYYW